MRCCPASAWRSSPQDTDVLDSSVAHDRCRFARGPGAASCASPGGELDSVMTEFTRHLPKALGGAGRKQAAQYVQEFGDTPLIWPVNSAALPCNGLGYAR